MIVHRVRARTDNYVWLVHDRAAGACVAVDPSEAAPVIDALVGLGVPLTGIWCTHHHHDHVGGNLELLARWPGIPVVGSDVDAAEQRIPGQTLAVGDGDVVPFAGGTARVLFIPAHTRGHIAYVLEDRLFCGDTLFGGGCGRLFEGTPAHMQAALARLRELPDETAVHCGHEYTWHNLRWAVETGLEPGNAALRARHARVATDPAQLTVPTRLGDEKATNPFMRWDSAELMAQTGETDAVKVFAELRRRKDSWRA